MKIRNKIKGLEMGLYWSWKGGCISELFRPNSGWAQPWREIQCCVLSDGAPWSSLAWALDWIDEESIGWMMEVHGRLQGVWCTWSVEAKLENKKMLGPGIEPRSSTFPNARFTTGPPVLVCYNNKTSEYYIKQNG